MVDGKNRGFDQIQNFYLSHRPLILYGAGMEGDIYANYLKTFGIGIDAFCDGDPGKHGKIFHDVRIVTPEELVVRYSGANIAVTVSAQFIPEITERLKGLGVEAERIFTDTQQYLNYTHRVRDFSVNISADLFRFQPRLADEESRGLFRLRYRHWLLGDRPHNDADGGWLFESIRHYDNAETFCDQMDRIGTDAIKGDQAVEFANDDSLFPPRMLFGIAYYRPKNRLYLRSGKDIAHTLLISLGEVSRHVV